MTAYDDLYEELGDARRLGHMSEGWAEIARKLDLFASEVRAETLANFQMRDAREAARHRSAVLNEAADAIQAGPGSDPESFDPMDGADLLRRMAAAGQAPAPQPGGLPAHLAAFVAAETCTCRAFPAVHRADLHDEDGQVRDIVQEPSSGWGALMQAKCTRCGWTSRESWFTQEFVRPPAQTVIADHRDQWTGECITPALQPETAPDAPCPCRERGQDGDGRVGYRGRDGEFVNLPCRGHAAAAPDAEPGTPAADLRDRIAAALTRALPPGSDTYAQRLTTAVLPVVADEHATLRARVHAIHREVDGSPHAEGSCIEDGQDYPCATLRALGQPDISECPGVSEYGHGLTARTVHWGCCRQSSDAEQGDDR